MCVCFGFLAYIRLMNVLFVLFIILTYGDSLYTEHLQYLGLMQFLFFLMQFHMLVAFSARKETLKE